MTTSNFRATLALTASVAALMAATGAYAAEARPTNTGAGAEGTDVNDIIVTAERSIGAKKAPVKASLEQTQPESIVSRDFIEQVTPETGNISTVIAIAPSITAISSNGGGIGNYFSTSMRGFQDGFYNLTYDGIAFGDTNNPTHHPNDYFPASTIGAAVVDRGPGAAGDLGQANYGGAIHYFSPNVSDTFDATQKFTYGSFRTEAAVTTINTGYLPQLGGGKLLINLDERVSNTQLSYSGGDAWNQLVKYELPVGDKFKMTAFFSHAYSRYNFPDSNGPGETLAQVAAYGKDWQLTNISTDEHYYKFNFERKQTYFDYVDFKYQISPNLKVENEPYQYFYSNKTDSSNDNSGLIGSTSSKPKIGPSTDIGGYLKRNDYTVIGDITRITDELPFGVLKIGGLVEGSKTYRQKAYYDFTNDFSPVNRYTVAANPLLTQATNCKTCEHSNWLQEQFFVDFDWTPISALKVSPGFKYVNFKRTIDAAQDTLTDASGNSTIAPIHGTNTYTSPLYFLTANYKILPYWSVYGQYATSFLIPQLSELQVPGVTLQNLKPETTVNYQAGTVYSRGALTADADVYRIEAANTNVACNIPDGSGGYDAASCNAGKVTYSGVEGETAYALPFGLTLFANGSINDAKQHAQAPGSVPGVAGNVAQELASTPKWTAALGAIYAQGPWTGSLTYKQVGDSVVYNTQNTTYESPRFQLPVYDTLNGVVAYKFSRFQVKFQVFNILDKRALTNYVPDAAATGPLYDPSSKNSTSFYTYQGGRELQLTLVAHY